MEVSSFAACELPQTPQRSPFSVASVLIPKASINVDGLIDERQVDGAIAHIPDTTTVSEPVSVTAQDASPQIWKLFGSTFITMFLAELGDKTQVATLLMTAESHAPWIVFAGAAAALISTSLLGVLVGQWLSSRVSPKTLDRAAGITLALLSLWLVLDALKM